MPLCVCTRNNVSTENDKERKRRKNGGGGGGGEKKKVGRQAGHCATRCHAIEPSQFAGGAVNGVRVYLHVLSVLTGS